MELHPGVKAKVPTRPLTVSFCQCLDDCGGVGDSRSPQMDLNQTLAFNIFSVVVMIILSFKLLKSTFSTFNLRSRFRRGVVHGRKHFKL
jgi:hypothetical protein